MVNALPLRIFLASPGDAEAERAAVRAAVDEFNARRESDDDVAYEVVGWDRVRGTARRPQEAINELLGESHFLVAIFKGSWGSEPGSTWGYTSGTEEELFTALLELGQPEQPMRDVWVAFVNHPSPDERIASLKMQMSVHHSMMYESITDARDLKQKFAERLQSWQAVAGYKVPRHVELLPSSGKDVLRAANLRIRGEKLIDLGQVDPGQKALAEAAILGGPVELLAHARFQARHGDLQGAYVSTQRAIDHFTGGDSALYSPLAADAFAAQAGVLRRQGQHVDAIGRLEHALTLLREPDSTGQYVRCRILDELGLAYQTNGDRNSARQRFEESLAARRVAGSVVDECQSLINLARLEVAENNLETAATHATEVIQKLGVTPPTSLHANAEVLVAQIALRQGLPDEGVAHAKRALSVNRQIANKLGEAIAHLLLAQCHRAAGRVAEAAGHARTCLELNIAISNRDGEKRAQWLLAQLSAEEV